MRGSAKTRRVSSQQVLVFPQNRFPPGIRIGFGQREHHMIDPLRRLSEKRQFSGRHRSRRVSDHEQARGVSDSLQSNLGVIRIQTPSTGSINQRQMSQQPCRVGNSNTTRGSDPRRQISQPSRPIRKILNRQSGRLVMARLPRLHPRVISRGELNIGRRGSSRIHRRKPRHPQQSINQRRLASLRFTDHHHRSGVSGLTGKFIDSRSSASVNGTQSLRGCGRSLATQLSDVLRVSGVGSHRAS